MMSDNPFQTAKEWLGLHFMAGAKFLGVTCNPIRRELYLVADDARLTIPCKTQRETRLLKDLLHDFIGSLPREVRP